MKSTKKLDGNQAPDLERNSSKSPSKSFICETALLSSPLKVSFGTLFGNLICRKSETRRRRELTKEGKLKC